MVKNDRAPAMRRWTTSVILLAILLPPVAAAQTVRARPVLVLPFAVKGAEGDGWVGEGVAELLALAFSNHHAVSPINRARLARVGVEGAVDERGALVAGRALKADLVLFGEIERTGGHWTIHPRLLGSRAGGSEAGRIEPMSGAEDQFFNLVGQVALAYLNRFSVAVSADEAKRIRRASIVTENWRAFEAYVKGRRMFVAETTAGNEGAAELFARAIEIDPNFAVAHYYLGMAQLRLGNRWKAAAQFRAATQVDASVPEPYKALGDLFMASPRRLHDQAIEAYQRAIEIRPFYADAYVGIGDVRAAKGQADPAIADYQKALSFNPLNPRVYVSLGKIYFAEKGLYYEAVEAYKRAIEIDANFVEARMGLGEVYEDKGLYREAVEEYTKVVEQDPAHTGALYNLALVYEKVDPKEAVARWERYIAVASQIPSEKDWVDVARQHIRKLKGQLEKGN